MSYKAAVLTISDKGARGEREDTSGPALCAMLRAEGYEVVHTAILPDERDQISAELIRCSIFSMPMRDIGFLVLRPSAIHKASADSSRVIGSPLMYFKMTSSSCSCKLSFGFALRAMFKSPTVFYLQWVL